MDNMVQYMMQHSFVSFVPAVFDVTILIFFNQMSIQEQESK